MCKTNWKIKKINKYEGVKKVSDTNLDDENHLIIDSVTFAPRISYTKDETI